MSESDNAARRAQNDVAVEEFRATGRVARLAGIPILLLHTTGARSGRALLTPLAHVPDGGTWVVFGANGGRPADPGWVWNLRAQPRARIETGTDGTEIPVLASILPEGAARERLWATMLEISPFFAGFAERRERPIAVVRLSPV